MLWDRYSTEENRKKTERILPSGNSHFILKNNRVCLAVLGLRCCAPAFSSCSEQGLPSRCGVRPSRCRGFSCCRALVVEAARLESTGSGVMVHGLSCSAAHGIFPDQGANLCLLHWQVDSLPRSHQGSPSSRRYFEKEK